MVQDGHIYRQAGLLSQLISGHSPHYVVSLSGVQLSRTGMQSSRNSWIERIPYHIQEVLRLQGRNEYLEGHPRTKRDKAYWAALQRERQNRIRDNVTVHRAALQQFRCSTAGLPTRYAAHYESLVGIQTTTADVENLDGDQWNNIPATDQVIYTDEVDPAAMLVSSRGSGRGRRGVPRDGGVRNRGRPPEPPKYSVRFQAPMTLTSWQLGLC